MRHRNYYLQIILSMVMTMVFVSGYGQNPPTIGTPENDTLYLNSGTNFLLIPQVNDNDDGIDQDISFTVTSSDETVLEILSTDFTAGDRMAVVHVEEKGKLGTVNINVEADDGDGIASASFQVTISVYNTPGINFEIHDMVFWQQNVPLDATPAYTRIATDGKAPYDSIDLASLNLSVYSDCQDTTVCTGTDFFTSFFRGYVIPPTTGTYKFYTRSGDQASLAISSDESFIDMDILIHTSNGIGESTGGPEKEWGSADIELEAGKVYAIYMAKWNIHTLAGGMLWEGPGIARDYIEGKYLSYVIDQTKPTTPTDFNLITTGIDDMLVNWGPSFDDQQLASYCIYLNGIKNNTEILLDTSYQVSALTNNSIYSVAVSGIDWAGNESALSEIITTTTYESDDTPPTPPTTINAPEVSDIAALLVWTGATDNESEIRGYNIYLHGDLYNTDELVYDTSLVLYHLTPDSVYYVTIEAVDAGNNVSEKSESYTINTTSFDPSDVQFGDNKARMTIEYKNIGTNAGLGVNVQYHNGEFNNDLKQMELLEELQPANIRWGAITANSLNFADYIGTDRPNNITIAEFIAIANDLDAYPVFTCGVENSTDWMTNEATFTNFLEYIAGPADSEYGAIRADEGYTDPLLQNCKGLIFEFGNEVWGADAHDAQIGADYTQYRQWARDMAIVMRNSSYYNSTKIKMVYSGRHPHPEESWGVNTTVLTGDNGEVDWLALSGYLGGNFAPEIETGDSELGYYKNGIAKLAFSMEGLVLTMQEMLELTGRIMPSYFYESNMTTNTFFGRLGQTVTQTDYYMEAIEHGGVFPTIFHFTGGQWKMIVPSQDYRKLALFEAAKLINRHCKGNILSVNVESEAVLTDADGVAVDADPVSCHAYTMGENYGIVLISRDFTRDFSVQINLPGEFPFKQTKKYVLSGDSYSSSDFTLDSASLLLYNGKVINVPKYSMVVIAFEGDDLEMDTLPVGHFEYKKATGITLRPQNDDGWEISENRETKTFVAEFEPADALFKVAYWEIEENEVDVSITETANNLRVRGSGNCEGNGTIAITASIADNREVKDEGTIVISNQGSNCNLSVSGQDVEMDWKVFPNPVNNGILNLISAGGADQALVTVTNMLGEVVFQQHKRGNELAIETRDWSDGMYTVSILEKEGIETFQVLINR